MLVRGLRHPIHICDPDSLSVSSIDFRLALKILFVGGRNATELTFLYLGLVTGDCTFLIKQFKRFILEGKVT